MRKLSSKAIKTPNKNKTSIYQIPLMVCPLCAKEISALSGTRDALCLNCGYKEPCCD